MRWLSSNQQLFEQQEWQVQQGYIAVRGTTLPQGAFRASDHRYHPITNPHGPNYGSSNYAGNSSNHQHSLFCCQINQK